MPTRRILAVIIALAVSAALTGSVEAAPPAPRVAVIVGPAGELTGLYRSIGADAAREARRWTSDVVTVMTPNATWPAVKRALRGASVVVYLGHGNGFPSPYRDSLYPPTQNGLGLNPIAAGDDTSHQYFGEAFLAREVRLAPGAVVLLHHLCYASGNSEPGLPEGSLDVGRQRVDNYAAGWLAAGAGAVVADTFGAPGPYLKALFGTDQTIDRIWHDSPTSHDHVLTFPSARMPGYQAAMDPTRVTSGFNRSLVTRPGLTAADMRNGAGRVATLPVRPIGPADPTVSSLASLGVAFRAPRLAPVSPGLRGLVAGSRATLSLPVKAPIGVTLPSDLQLGVRWDPIAVDPPVESIAASDPGPGPTPTPTPSPIPRGRPIPTPSPIVDPTPTEPPPIEPVAPEVLGSVVTTARAKLVKGRLRVSLTLPTAAGRYRLVTTVHGPDGIAFDAATQVLVPALTVRVSRPVSAAYGVAPTVRLPAGATTVLPVRVANDGSLAWADPATVPEELIDPSVVRGHPSARLIGHWIPLSIDASTDGLSDLSVPISAPPGSETTVEVGLTAPTAPGDYLLILDVDSPLHGSLAAGGVPLGQVRVTVVAPAGSGQPGTSPAPTATPAAP
jgi:hypothetical protein